MRLCRVTAHWWNNRRCRAAKLNSWNYRHIAITIEISMLLLHYSAKRHISPSTMPTELPLLMMLHHHHFSTGATTFQLNSDARRRPAASTLPFSLSPLARFRRRALTPIIPARFSDVVILTLGKGRRENAVMLFSSSLSSLILYASNEQTAGDVGAPTRPIFSLFSMWAYWRKKLRCLISFTWLPPQSRFACRYRANNASDAWPVYAVGSRTRPWRNDDTASL